MNDLFRKTTIKHWFIEQMKEMVELEECFENEGKELQTDARFQPERRGSRRLPAQILGGRRRASGRKRSALGAVECWDAVPVSGVENAAYFNSTTRADRVGHEVNRKVMVLARARTGSGRGSSSLLLRPCRLRPAR